MEQVSNQNRAISQNFNWSDFFSFRRMIALQIMQILYIVVAIFITLAGLAAIFRGESRYDSSFMPGGFLGGLLIIIFGNIAWRLWCEFIIVLFRIDSSLSNIDDNTRRNMIASLPSKE